MRLDFLSKKYVSDFNSFYYNCGSFYASREFDGNWRKKAHTFIVNLSENRVDFATQSTCLRLKLLVTGLISGLPETLKIGLNISYPILL
jgi:hypothetical protein